MCFIVSDKQSKVLITKKPIKVYKIVYMLDSVAHSFYYQMIYIPGIIYKTIMSTIEIPAEDDNRNDFKKTIVENGFHSYITLHNVMFDPHPEHRHNIYVAAFTIPAGAKYYKNKRDYVSNQIVFDYFIYHNIPAVITNKEQVRHYKGSEIPNKTSKL